MGEQSTMAFEHFWRRLAIGAALATALLATGMEWANAQATPAALPTELQGVHRVVCLGDSITQFGESPGGYVWLVRHYLADLYPSQAIEVDNAGISGNTSQDEI